MATKKTKGERELQFLQTTLERGRIDDGFIRDIHGIIYGEAIKIPEYVINLTRFFSVGVSKEEEQWAILGATMIEGFFESKPVFWGYEWQSYKLPGGSYTPDFSYLLKDGRWVHIEVKGSTYQRDYAYSRARLRATAALNPWFIFAMAIKKGRSNIWDIEIIKPDDFLNSSNVIGKREEGEEVGNT